MAGWHVEDCFVMAADTNLKVGGQARVRNYTVWQLGNAEPLWIREPDGCVVDGLHVVNYGSSPRGQTVNISRGGVRNSVFKIHGTTGTLSPSSILRFGEDAKTRLRCCVYAVCPMENYRNLGGRQVP